ncbi:MAG: 6-hydroxymethylpterin diphosphokinase MptE-like protein [Candidatus Hodarchaeota archaeon]
MDRKKVFIIGGGPSLKCFDFKLLKNQNTIAVNFAAEKMFERGFIPTYFLTADSGVIITSVMKDFWGLKDKCTTVVVMGEEHPNFKRAKSFLDDFDVRIKPYRTDTGNMGFTFDEFVTGKNTGFCALQYAVVLGFENIYLLGFDLDKDKEGDKYWYAKGGRVSPYNIFLEHFITGIRKVHKYSKIKIYLSSKPSKLEPYLQYCPIQEAIK